MNENFGNKYKNLVFLKNQKDLQDLYDFKIPNFFGLNIDFYNYYLQGYEIFTSNLLDFYNKDFKNNIIQFSTDSIILRSSSLYSEDSKEYFGAGLYKSIVISKNSSFDEFENAVIAIYESLNDYIGVDFRNKNDIKDEKMGIIIQEYFSPDKDFSSTYHIEYKGFINSIIKNSSKTSSISQCGASIVLDTDKIKNIGNNELEKYFNSGDDSKLNKGILKLPYDTYKIGYLDYIRLSKIGIELRDKYTFEVQIEYVISNGKIYIVQLRPFPSYWSKEEAINFPVDMEEILSVDCCFPFKGKILDTSFADYIYNDRIRFKVSSHMASMLSDDEIELFIETIPDILFIDTYTNADHGHLESIVVERGGIVINGHNVSNENKIKLKNEKQLYVVSDGIQAKFYKVQTIFPVNDKKIYTFIDYKLHKYFSKRGFNSVSNNSIALKDNFFSWLQFEFTKEFHLYKKSEDFYKYLLDYLNKNTNKFSVKNADDIEKTIITLIY